MQNDRVGFGHLAWTCRARDDQAVSIAEPEPLISREEVVATMFMIADIATDVNVIRRVLEEDNEEEADQ